MNWQSKRQFFSVGPLLIFLIALQHNFHWITIHCELTAKRCNADIRHEVNWYETSLCARFHALHPPTWRCVIFLPPAVREAHAVQRYFLVLLGRDFEVFRPTGATRRTDGNDIWLWGAIKEMSKGPAKKNCVGNTDVSYDRKSTPPRQISRPSVQGWGMGPKILWYKRVAPAHPLYDIFSNF